jgi:hypothetical protein
MVYNCVSKTFFLAEPFWFQKTATEPHNLAYVKIVCPDDRYRKLNIYSSELILDSYVYMTVALRNKCIA